MNRIFFIFFAILFLSETSCGNIENNKSIRNLDSIPPVLSEDSVKKNISNKVTLIEKELYNLDKSEIEVLDKSSEGGVANAYFNEAGIPAAIIVDLFGAMGKSKQAFYYDEGKTIFSRIIDTLFDRPINMPNRVIDTVKSEGFYFWGQSLTEKENLVFQDGMYYKRLFIK